MVREIKNKNFITKIKDADKRFLFSYVFFAILMLVSATSFYMTRQRIDIRQRAQNDGADVILAFDRKSAMKGQTLTMDVNVDSRAVPIQEVRFDFSYPSQKATVDLDYDNENFDTLTEELISSGVIRFGRSTQKDPSGKIHIGKIKFSATTDFNSNEISYLPTTQLQTYDNKEVPLYLSKEFKTDKGTSNKSVSLIQQIFEFIKNLFSS